MANNSFKKFDTGALFDALDAKRVHRGLTWSGVAREFWRLDASLNEKRANDHPFSPSTIRSMKEKQRTSCQHALFMLRWLDQAPECFLENAPPSAGGISLPRDAHRRLRWSLKRLYQRLDMKRRAEDLSWVELAAVLGCKPNQLTGLRSPKFATNIDLTMRIVQWTGRPSIDFMHFTNW